MAVVDRFKNAWNAFMNRDPTRHIRDDYDSYISSTRPDRFRFTSGNEKSIVTFVYNRMAVDAAAISIQHVRLDRDGRYEKTIDSDLNNCLTLDANIDQTGRAFLQDVYMSLFDEGSIAVVPTDTSEDPAKTDSYKIFKMRVGKIVEWHPSYVKVRLYNEKNGKKQEIFVNKADCAIVENPFYSVMNEPNSTVYRLLRKLSLLDVVDEQTSSGKLDLIIQLPYVIKTEARRKQAEERRKDIEMQLAGSRYGIAYTDGSEHITQLNRSLENNLLKEIEGLQNTLYSQLGLTEAILNGSAKEEEMLAYQNRIIEPVVSALTDEMKRKFLTKTARSQGQSIKFFRDPFKLVPISQIAEIADRFTRNEVLSSNEVRQIIGMKPVNTDRANELVNKNMPIDDTGQEGSESGMVAGSDEEALGQIDSSLDELERMANEK